ncbi:MAG TPA: protease inhibitor I42 family protein [Acidimicrobiales bacterium]|nr:protease inhibitor I42 family protein [Acidimicrobiales bacterium]
MAELPSQLDLTVGQAWTVQLEAAGGGYRWHAEVEGDDAVVAVTAEYAEHAEGGVQPGRWRGDVVTVTGLAPGHASVVLGRRRSWETSGAGGEERMRVTVRPT